MSYILQTQNTSSVEIINLINNSELQTGKLYQIDGVHPTLYNDGTNSGTTILLEATSSNTLKSDGIGIFYNPKYNSAVNGWGVWSNHSTFVASGITGTFNSAEAFTGNNGATGTLIADAASGGFYLISGNATGLTSITGNVTGATANVASIVIRSFAVGDKVIYGGYVWSNVNGNIGAAVNSLSLNSEWTKIAYNTTDYNKVFDQITYDQANNWISRRYSSVSDNEVLFTPIDATKMGKPFHAISVFQWGNPGTAVRGVVSNYIHNAYCDNINFKGSVFVRNRLTVNAFVEGNNFFPSTDDFCGLYSNTLSTGASIKLNTSFGGIGENTINGAGYIGYSVIGAGCYIRLTNISGNGYLYNNKLFGACQIYANSILNNGYIRDMVINCPSGFPILSNYIVGSTSGTTINMIGYSNISGTGSITGNFIQGGGAIKNATVPSGSTINNNLVTKGSVVQNLNLSGFQFNKNIIANKLMDLANVAFTGTISGLDVDGGLPVYPDNATALAAGLKADSKYKTATGDFKIVY